MEECSIYLTLRQKIQIKKKKEMKMKFQYMES